jgi:RND family efflux transporter MFP subunit
MKRSIGWGLVPLVCVGAGLAWWWPGRSQADAAAAPPAPVVQIRSEIPHVQSVAQRLEAVGDVTSGQSSDLSFARAGQVTELHVVAGDRVVKGGVLARLTPDPTVRAAYQQAVDAAALAQREWERQKQLLAARLATQSQVDSAEKAARDAQGVVRALDEQGGGQGSSTLVAPFDGVVASVSAVQGDRVAAGAPVLQVGRADTLRVVIGIEPSDRAKVRAGTRVTLWPVLPPGASAPPIAAQVSEVQNAVDPKTQLIGAVARLAPGAAAPLAAGMKVRAQLDVGAVSAIAVPRNAVLTDERGDYLFQVDGARAHRVKVTRRLDDGTLVAIAGLANEKLPVVVEGNYELQDGMAVKDAAP